MTADPRLSGEDRAITDGDRAGNSYLRHQQAFFADANVVSDVHEVVDFGAVAHYRIVDASPIDRSVRPDLHIVADDAATNVLNLLVRSVAKYVAEAVTAESRSRMHEHAVAERRPAVNRDRWP